VDLAAYRVVQEALTNVAKHAGPGTRAEVRLAWATDRLEVEVIDDGRGEPAPGAEALSTGHGLRGLAERMAAVGGGLESGPEPGRGFRVRATLPLPDPTSTVDDGSSGAAARTAG
jgi:signal transduction histidine kinase